MDIASFIGLFGSIAILLVANIMDGGHTSALMLPTAAMIVLGGSIGATMTQNTMGGLMAGLIGAIKVFFPKKHNPVPLIKQIVDFARVARREGILALEKEIPNINSPFFSKALTMAVDGLEPKTLFESLETEMETYEEHEEVKVKVWEAIGGYAPTVGIIGAVMGLIHVMSNLDDPAKLGSGIATAFVATIYGIAVANLVALPIANKIKMQMKDSIREFEIMVRGVLLIQEGINHGVIQEQLKGFLSAKQKKAYAAIEGDEG